MSSECGAIRRPFFVDNSRFISPLERLGDNLILARPPCWGQSLLQSMLAAYYDRSTSPELFRQLFGELDIGKQPTPLARSLYVLPLNLTVDTGEPDAIRQRLTDAINASIGQFAARYDLPDIRIYADNANLSFRSACNVVEQRKGQLYLLLNDSVANWFLRTQNDDWKSLKAATLVDDFLDVVRAADPARSLITSVHKTIEHEWFAEPDQAAAPRCSSKGAKKHRRKKRKSE